MSRLSHFTGSDLGTEHNTYLHSISVAVVTVLYGTGRFGPGRAATLRTASVAPYTMTHLKYSQQRLFLFWEEYIMGHELKEFIKKCDLAIK